jgi:hypothetical protein
VLYYLTGSPRIPSYQQAGSSLSAFYMTLSVGKSPTLDSLTLIYITLL